MNNDFSGTNNSSRKSDSPSNNGSLKNGICALILAAGLSTRMTPLLKGDSKALCTLRGEMLLERCCTLFKRLGIEDVYVVTGHDEERVSAVAVKLGMRTVHNTDFQEGMFSSIKAGIRALEQQESRIFSPADSRATSSSGSFVADSAGKTKQYDAFFLLPVDIPLVSPTVVQHLFDYWANLDSSDHHQSSTIHEVCESQASHCSRRSQRASRQGTMIIPEVGSQPGHPPLIGRDHWPAILCWDGEGGLQGYVASLGETVTAGGRCVRRVEVGDEKVLWDIDTPEDFEKADRYIKDSGA